MKFEEVSPWTFDEDGFEKLSHESLVVMVKRTAAEFETVPMRGETWRALPAKFETRMCEMKSLRSEDL